MNNKVKALNHKFLSMDNVEGTLKEIRKVLEVKIKERRRSFEIKSDRWKNSKSGKSYNFRTIILIDVHNDLLKPLDDLGTYLFDGVN